MNEKIRALAELAEVWHSYEDCDRCEVDVEKFAELIVKECLNNMNNCSGDLDFAIWKTEKDFGIDNDNTSN